MRVLLSGSTGMVGRNFLERVADSSLEVFAPSHTELDFLDFPAVVKYVRSVHPDIMIHAAGRVGGIMVNMKYPVEFLMENLDMGRNAIWAAFQAGVPKFLNLGSSCMYPCGTNTGLTEDMILGGPLEPTNEGYALAKIVATRLCEYITREYPGYQYKTLIPCNLYGRWDKFDGNNAHLIPAVISKIHEAVVKKEETVEIWGDGMARREFMYAGDLADCLEKATREFDSLPPQMNVGIGCDVTINEYYHLCADIIGFKGAFLHDLNRPVGMERKLVDIVLQNRWGWQPKTDLRSGIEQTYQFFLEHNADKEGR